MAIGWRIILIALLQTLALAGMVGAKQCTLSTGRPVVLEVRPVDPRSLFSGDFVILNYDINRLAKANLDGEKQFRRDARIYVRLAQNDGRWQAASVHQEIPETSAADIVLSGKVEWANRSQIRVKYGIEAFYVPEGKGRKIEKQIRGAKVQAEVVVDSRGRGVLRALIIDGKYRYDDPLF